MVENYQEMLSSEHSGFIRHNGIRVVSVDEEKSVLTADVTPENSNIWGDSNRRRRRADRPRRDQHVFSEKVRNALKGSVLGKARCAPFFILVL